MKIGRLEEYRGSLGGYEEEMEAIEDIREKFSTGI